MKNRIIIVIVLYLTVAMSVNGATYELSGKYIAGYMIGQIRTFQENEEIGVLLEVDDYYETDEESDDSGELISIGYDSEWTLSSEPEASNYPTKLWLVISPDEFTGFVRLLDRLFIAFNRHLRGEEELIDISFDGFSTCMVGDIENEELFYVRKSSSLGNGIITYYDAEDHFHLCHQYYLQEGRSIDCCLSFNNPKEVSDLKDTLIKIAWGEPI